MGLESIDLYFDFSVSFACSPEELDWLSNMFARKKHRGIVDYRALFTDGVAWFYSIDAPGYDGAMRRLALFIKQFLLTFRKQGSIGFTYSCTSQEFLPGGFFGGAYFITAYRIYHQSTADWLRDRAHKFEHMRRKK